MNNTCDILIKNANAVIPFSGIVKTNILIDKGKIKALKKTIGNVTVDKVINAEGKYILPGIIDPHEEYDGVITNSVKAAHYLNKSNGVSVCLTDLKSIIRNYTR